MTPADRPSSQLLFDTAKQIAGDEQLPFAEAHALCRIVLELGGGPVSLKGPGAPTLDKKVVRGLERRGLLERGGGEGAPRADVTSVRDYSTAPGDWTASVHLTGGRLHADTISASDEAIALVRRFAIRGDAAAPDVDDPETEEEEDAAPDDDPADEVEDEDVDTGDSLGDLEEIATELFDVWWGGSEVRWAASMWDVLERAGLTRYDDGDEVGRSLVVCRLVALAGINVEFAARAFEEGDPGDWRNRLDADLMGDYPRLDPIALGRLAERQGAWVQPEFDGRESPHDLILAVAGREWRTVARALLDDLGEARLFAALWMTSDDSARYPLSEEVVREVVNTDNTEEKVASYGWVRSGCR